MVGFLMTWMSYKQTALYQEQKQTLTSKLVSLSEGQSELEAGWRDELNVMHLNLQHFIKSQQA